MFSHDDLVLDCRTCVAANTTACSDCVVHHLLANDDGPIAFVPSVVELEQSDEERAAQLFVGAGLLDEGASWLPYEQFEPSVSPQSA